MDANNVMKRKMVFIAVFSYLMLILLILILGLNLPKVEQPRTTDTESLTDQVDENEQAYSKTPVDIDGTHTATDFSTLSPEIELSQSPTPSTTSTITEVLETPTQTEPTSGVPSPTSTSEAYPINGDPGPTTTSQPYPVEGSTDVTFTPTLTISPSPISATETGWNGD